MRETKDQTIERLKGVIEEQKKEMTEIKKDRKRLNYAVDKLKKETQTERGKSSSDDIQKIKTLKTQIRQLERSIEERELEMKKKEERSKMIISREESTAKYWHRKYNDLWTSIEAEHNAYFEKTLIDLIQNRKGGKERKEILSAYERGELYYSLNENGEQKEYPIFSPSDLFIQIHPQTGLPLTKENFKVLYKWAEFQPDYQMSVGYWRNYLQNDHPSEKAIIQSAYNAGKKLLLLYEHLLF